MEVIYRLLLSAISKVVFSLGCSQYTIIPARYAYLLKTDITDAQASILERKSSITMTSSLTITLLLRYCHHSSIICVTSTKL